MSLKRLGRCHLEQPHRSIKFHAEEIAWMAIRRFEGVSFCIYSSSNWNSKYKIEKMIREQILMESVMTQNQTTSSIFDSQFKFIAKMHETNQTKFAAAVCICM